ncbi:MAG: hypothetical protein C4555_06465 [Dehalococcoidia bacterium]|nr:MAG: hypothetical protein C4555_06465 [Dehalococcoidia bacterium]
MAGKILRVDLSSGTLEKIPTTSYAPKFIGGWGLAAKIYRDEARPKPAHSARCLKARAGWQAEQTRTCSNRS